MSDDRGSSHTEIKVGLTRTASCELDITAETLGISRTDVVNRAVVLYGFLEKERGRGGHVVIRHGDEFAELDWADPPARDEADR